MQLVSLEVGAMCGWSASQSHLAGEVVSGQRVRRSGVLKLQIGLILGVLWLFSRIPRVLPMPADEYYSGHAETTQYNGLAEDVCSCQLGSS